VGGTINQDTTWSPSNGTYTITSTIVIPAGVTLTIEPGTYVTTQLGGISSTPTFRVGGALYLDGTAAEPVQLNPTNTDLTHVLFAGIANTAGTGEVRISHANVRTNALMPSSPGDQLASLSIVDSELHAYGFANDIIQGVQSVRLERNAVYGTIGTAANEGSHIQFGAGRTSTIVANNRFKGVQLVCTSGSLAPRGNTFQTRYNPFPTGFDGSSVKTSSSCDLDARENDWETSDSGVPRRIFDGNDQLGLPIVSYLPTTGPDPKTPTMTPDSFDGVYADATETNGVQVRMYYGSSGGLPVTTTIEAFPAGATEPEVTQTFTDYRPSFAYFRGLNPETTYLFKATATNDQGSTSKTSTRAVTPYPEPTFPTPTDFRSTSQAADRIDLAWAKVSGASSYIVSKQTGSGAPETKTVGDVSTTSFTGLSATTAYTFTIIAVKDSTTQSDPSAPLTVTTPAVPNDRPSNVRWTSRTATGLTVAWTKYPAAVKYKLKYYPAGDSALAKTKTVANVNTASITGLARGAKYSVRVAGISSSGVQSPYSSTATLETSNLLPPTNFVKKTRTSTSIRLTWTAAADAEGYRIFYGIGSGTRTKVEVSGGSTVTKLITGLKPGTTYTIDIASTELSGTSRSGYTPRITVKTSS
jgi:hypothetical protein